MTNLIKGSEITSFQGDTRECFRHFFTEFYDKMSDEQQRVVAKDLTNYFQLQNGTIQNWLDDKQFPQGEKLIKLRYWLLCLGYQNRDLIGLEPALKDCLKAIACDFITIEALAAKAGYKDYTELSRHILNKRKPSRQRLEWFQSYFDQNFAKKSLINFDYSFAATSPIDQSQSHKCLKTSQAPPNYLDGVAYLFKTLRAQIALTQGVMNDLAGENYSSEARQEFREIVGAEFMPKLATELLNLSDTAAALCSEKARENKLGLKSDIPTL